MNNILCVEILHVLLDQSITYFRKNRLSENISIGAL